MSIARIDADIVAYRCAASCEPSQKRADELGIPLEALAPDPLDIAVQRADELMYRILNTTQCPEYVAYISGSDNFRHKIYPAYKANRVGKQKPRHLENVKAFLISEWQARVTNGYEADDGIGIDFKDGDIVCSIDKDLRQIPGMHYHIVNDIFEDIEPSVAIRNFYSLMLVGDRSDNIEGVRGIGTVKAERLLVGRNEHEMESIVRDHYGDYDRFLLNKKLLRVLRSEEEYQNIVSESEGAEPAKACSDRDPEYFSDPL